MNNKKTRTWFSNRQFVAMIRVALDEAGYTSVAVSRQWIDEDTQGDAFHLHVPVGAALTIPLRPMSDFIDVGNADELMRHARQFASALVNLSRSEKSLEKFARSVGGAAEWQINVARTAGLDVSLDSVGIKPTRAYHLAGVDRKDAASSVLACVKVRHTSFFLRPVVTAICVEEPADLAQELAILLKEQRKRQDRIAELEALDTDLVVDQITLDLLAAHNLEADEVLCEVWKKQCINLRVKHLGRETPLCLTSSGGYVSATLVLEDAIWSGEYLWFTGDQQIKDHRQLIGKNLGDLVRHPVFASRPIIDVFHRHADHIVFDLSDKMLFDCDTGHFRPLHTVTNDAGATVGEPLLAAA